MMKTLHFTVHPDILNIIRDGYWFEDRKEWALSVLNSLNGMSLSIAMKLLYGEGGLTTRDNGETLDFVDKEDKIFKKELFAHKKFLEECKEEELKPKKEEYENLIREEEDDAVKNDTINQTSEIDGVGDTEIMMRGVGDTEIMMREGNQKMAMLLHAQTLTETDPAKKKANTDLIKSLIQKEYSFIFKGHNYTFEDSARNQGVCPHCNNRSKDGFWGPKDKAFIGKKKLENGHVYCFECPKCFEKFYYHNK